MKKFRLEAFGGTLPGVTNALAPRQVGAQRRPGGGLNSAGTRSRRGGTAGTFRDTRAHRLCLLSWARGEPTDALIERMRRAAFQWDRQCRIASVDSHAQVLLVPERTRGGPGRERLYAAIDAVVDAVHAVRPEAEIHEIGRAHV